MKTHMLAVIALFAVIASSLICSAEEKVDTLQDVVVTSFRQQEIIPVQQLSGDDLERLNSNSVADALRYFSGVQVKDYGGVGGIKTVNVRSMGTNHTGVVYDGIELGNAQNGQIDLGQFSLDNIEMISLHNGQKSELLQPARDYGSAASVYMRTKTPVFKAGKRFNGRFAVRFGSFDLINPSALLEFKLSEKINASLSAEWLNSSGKYKFRYKRMNPTGGVAYDTIATRQNGDINALRTELNFNGTYAGGDWHFKAYNYNSERGVPGAIVNNVWHRGERIWDNNTFAQGRSTYSTGKFTTMNSIKYAFYRTHYVNNDERQIKIDNLYRQQEVYFSSANEYVIFPNWRVSLSYDFQWNTLNADTYNFAKPDRFTNMLAGATSVSLGPVRIQASALGTFIHDKLRGRQTPKDKAVFTPAVYLSWTPFRSVRAFSVRAFYKRSFRMPTFNDLYYADMGNSKLDPERVTQYNVGLLYEKNFHGFLSAVRVSADGYINRVKNKIVAYPKGQQFRWTMLNLGKVNIEGSDVSAMVTVCPCHPVGKPLYLTLRAQYTYQHAIDVTDPSDNYYRDQIPYIPRHSGSVVLNADWMGWMLNYSYIYVGSRYNQQENIKYNYTQPWYTSDISLGKDLIFGKVKLRVLAEINNLFSQDYNVILNYPMPKRNYRFSIIVGI